MWGFREDKINKLNIETQSGKLGLPAALPIAHIPEVEKEM